MISVLYSRRVLVLPDGIIFVNIQGELSMIHFFSTEQISCRINILRGADAITVFIIYSINEQCAIYYTRCMSLWD